MIERPSDAQKCSGCAHPFGAHYTTYDGKHGGCSNFDDNQRDGGPCHCRGFAMIWQPAAER